MFNLTFDRNHNVLLARFAGVFSSEDVESLDRALGAFISRHGFARGIFDFSSVEANATPQTFLTWHGRFPQLLLGQERVIVAPQQSLTSWRAPTPHSSATSGTWRLRLFALSATLVICCGLNDQTSSRFRSVAARVAPAVMIGRQQAADLLGKPSDQSPTRDAWRTSTPGSCAEDYSARRW